MITINSDRLWQRLRDMGQIGGTPAGGCNRQALTDDDAAGRAQFVEWATAAGCSVRVDAIGNIFVRREGRDPALPVVMTGSHLDTQPSGGKYDGVYGVLAGLEVLESLNDHQLETDHALEVVVWTNEEGCRFDTAMMGSAVWSESMSLVDAWALEDADGVSVKTELERTGYLGEDLARQPVRAAFELHIEQGPILEAQAHTIGVVTGVQHMCRYRVIIRGQETHAGPSPMAMRRDPMMAVAQIFPGVYAIAEEHSPQSRVTIGYVHAEPGSPNTVPGEVVFTLDIRHPVEADYLQMQSAVEALIATSCDVLGLGHELKRVWEAPGVSFDGNCINSVRRATQLFNYPVMEMVSGAGHDACNIAAVVPVSMIFVPCKDGLSHNEAESIEPAQAEAGANVLLHAMLDSANE